MGFSISSGAIETFHNINYRTVLRKEYGGEEWVNCSGKAPRAPVVFGSNKKIEQVLNRGENMKASTQTELQVCQCRK